MCNCGNKRAAYNKEENNMINNSVSTTEPVPHRQTYSQEDRNFTYTGKTALTVKGTITGNTYRFTHSGHSQLIDYRDVPAMLAVPVLKKLS